MQRYRSFKSFYPYYLSEHRNRACRGLHFFGAVTIILMLAYIVMVGWWLGLLLLPVMGYGFGWIGHAFFERNTPTTSTYPFYSFCAYWVMVKDIGIGRLKL